jgi:hypothetical protein
MKVDRMVLAFFFLLPLAWYGVVASEPLQQTKTSKIVFFVH